MFLRKLNAIIVAIPLYTRVRDSR